MTIPSNNKISRRAAKFTFVLFFAVLLLDFADQSMVNPLVNTLLADFFNSVNNVVPLGWVTSVFTVLSALSMIFAGIYADRKSRIKLCFSGILIYSTFSMLTLLVPDGSIGYVIYFITRALNGIGVGLIVPAIYSMVGDMASRSRRTTAFAYISLAMLAGRMAGMGIASVSLEHWRTGYFGVGILSFFLAFGLLLVKEPRRGIQEKELEEVMLEGAEYRFRISGDDIRLLWKNRSNVWLVANFIDVIPGSMILFLIFKYFNDIHNVGAGFVTLTLGVVAVMGGIGTMVFGKMGDRGFRRNQRAKVWIALFCNIFPVVFMVVFLMMSFRVPDGAGLTATLQIPGVIVVILAIGMAMFVNSGVHPNWYATLTDVNLPEHRATMVSIASVMDMAGMALGPLIASYIATIWGMRTAMWSVLGFWIVNVLFWLPVLRHVRQDLSNLHNALESRAGQLRSETKK